MARIITLGLVSVVVCPLLVACGSSSEPQPLPASVPVAAGVAVPPQDPGAAVWKKTCAPCHDGGLGDGPAIGDAAAWKARTAQGTTVLLEHALNGFAGTIGEMPARGGDQSLTDAAVEAALLYMVEKSR